ncbi:MAG: alpha/beta hydrolase, partial [Candidatus Saccharimonadales bacterium]
DRKVKKPRATVVFLHGIGLSAHAWSEVIDKLPNDIRVITIDLLGFGQSPKPRWAIYSVRLQARMIIATFLRLRIRGPVVLVGHSLGALVSVEIAKRYPLLVRSMVLCSPPFYKQDPVTKRLLPHAENVLKDIYKAIHKNPEQFLKISQVAAKYGLVNKSFSVTSDDVHSYIGALEASIINQTSLQDAVALKRIPMQVIYGALDTVVIGKNLKYLANHNPNVTFTTVMAGHEVRGLYVPVVVKAVQSAIDTKKPSSKRS